MLPSPADREASSGDSPPPYLRRRPERTLLYQLVEEYYPAFDAHLAAQGRDAAVCPAGVRGIPQVRVSRAWLPARALNLNIHFPMLFLNGVYVERPDGSLRFRWVKAPTSAELSRLTQALALRIGR